MKKLEINLPDTVNTKDIIRQISFVCEDIKKYEINENKLCLYYEHVKDADRLIMRVQTMVKAAVQVSQSEEIYFQNTTVKSYIDTETIMSGRHIINCGEGMIGLSAKGLELFEYFDTVFKGFAAEMGAVAQRYPVLLCPKTLQDTGYLRTSPQYVHYVHALQEDMEVLSTANQREDIRACYADMTGVLSPSACFHVYEHYRSKTLEDNTAVTLLQSVFRNEGRFNWKEYGRLRDYHVRELVFIGSESYVRESLTELMDKTSRFIKKIGFNGVIQSSGDSFVLPNMQRFQLIQLKNKVKYEVRLNYSEDEQISAASFNLHGKAFTYPFQIKVKSEQNTVTGCAGYGLERWVLAYLSQFGDTLQNRRYRLYSDKTEGGKDGRRNYNNL